jgi:hypothetical protein
MNTHCIIEFPIVWWRKLREGLDGHGSSPLVIKYPREKSPSKSPQKRIDATGVEWHKYPCITMKLRSHSSL